MNDQVFFESKLLEKKSVTPDVVQLLFEKPVGFEHKAGQFVRFKIPHSSGELLRSYSISSISSDPNLQFCIKIVEGGRGSVFLASLEPGDSISLSNPRGHFVCENLSRINYFIATGAGIAPIMAMVEEAVAEHQDKRFELVFGVREEKDIFWEDRLQRIADRNKNFSYSVCLSKPSEGWSGKKGRVTEHTTVDPSAMYYLCGSVDMIKAVRTKLLHGHVNTKSVHFEIF